jgi:hypothetical protein
MTTIEDIVTSDKKFTIVIGEDESLMREIADKSVDECINRVILMYPENGLYPIKHVRFIENAIIATRSSSYSTLLITNSSYIVDHLVNLMKAYDVYERTRNPALLKQFLCKDPLAFISKDHVDAYLAVNGTVQDIFNREKGTINWDTFSDVAEFLMNIYFCDEMEQ